MQALAHIHRTHADDVGQRDLHDGGRTVAHTPLQHQRLALERIDVTGDRPAHKRNQQQHGIAVERQIKKAQTCHADEEVYGYLGNRQAKQYARNAQHKALPRQGLGSVMLPYNDFFHAYS